MTFRQQLLLLATAALLGLLGGSTLGLVLNDRQHEARLDALEAQAHECPWSGWEGP